MNTPKKWGDKPYFPVSQFYKERFGEKVYKIPVSYADDCPNRQGLKGMETCIFCDEWGSAAYKETRDHELVEQIELNKQRVRARYKGHKFLIYFQAYTTTFTQLHRLQSAFERVLDLEGVEGIVIGTRPDCLSAAALKLWRRIHEEKFVSVELGVQSLNDRHLEFLRRGHSGKQSIEAIRRIHEHSGVDIGVHLMFGSPGETVEEVALSASTLSSLPVDNVKLHNLHVLKNTPLETLYTQGGFAPIELEAYAQRVGAFLQYLRPDIYIHRLGAYAQNWDELVAPSWANDKMYITQYITDYLLKEEIYQGQKRSSRLTSHLQSLLEITT
jgi:radical SAM protein (TIGR01212 family)